MLRRKKRPPWAGPLRKAPAGKTQAYIWNLSRPAKICLNPWQKYDGHVSKQEAEDEVMSCQVQGIPGHRIKLQFTCPRSETQPKMLLTALPKDKANQVTPFAVPINPRVPDRQAAG